MLSGVLTSDSLTQAFRSLSQKRRHGVLDIASPTGQVLIYFYNGKIIGAQSPERPFVEAVSEKLKSAGVISADLCETLKESIGELPELHSVLVGRKIVSPEQFLRAKRTYEMDILYGLRRVQGGVFKFNSKIVDVDDSLALAIAPGQLLLDMVELDAAESRLKADLKAPIESDVCVVPLGSAGPDLSEEEAEVWRTLEVTHCVREIRDRALLTEYQLTEALLGLLERRLIAPGPSGSKPAASAGNNRNPLAHLLDDLDDVAPVSPVKKEERERSNFNALIDEAANLLEAGLDDLDLSLPVAEEVSEGGDVAEEVEASLDVVADEVEASGGEVLESSETLATWEDRAESVAELPPVVDRELAPSSITSRGVSFKDLLSISNVRLLDDDVLNKVSLIMTFLFLVALGWLGPRMVDHLFLAAELFSSVNQ